MGIVSDGVDSRGNRSGNEGSNLVNTISARAAISAGIGVGVRVIGIGVAVGVIDIALRGVGIGGGVCVRVGVSAPPLPAARLREEPPGVPRKWMFPFWIC